jgi:prepilin-type N-terminal cleavage/methylation domain-containing protein
MRAPTRRRAFTLIELLVVIAAIGNGITVTVVEVEGNRVRLGFDAPDKVRILRGELACWQDGPLNDDLEGKRDCSQVAESDREPTGQGSGRRAGLHLGLPRHRPGADQGRSPRPIGWYAAILTAKGRAAGISPSC